MNPSIPLIAQYEEELSK